MIEKPFWEQTYKDENVSTFTKSVVIGENKLNVVFALQPSAGVSKGNR